MNNYAIVENGVVTNIILWDGDAEWSPPVGATAVLIPAETVAGIGYTYDGTTFTAPAQIQPSAS